MTYPKEWKGKVRVPVSSGEYPYGTVLYEGRVIGRVVSRHVPGAKSPGGMVTNTEWLIEGNLVPFASQTQAIQTLIKRQSVPNV